MYQYWCYYTPSNGSHHIVRYSESTRSAALRLGRLARAGWISHVRRGLYYLPPLDAGPHVIADDSWVLADAIFAPCYIGGWSAAEHWGLTEQLFRFTFVATATHIRKRAQAIAGNSFHLTKVPLARIESVPLSWRGTGRLRVSSADRTIVDAFRDPSWVGGIRHLGSILVAYRDSKEGSDALLAKALGDHGNGAAHKRAGYLASRLWPSATALVDSAAAGVSAGVLKLDPAIATRGDMNSRWGLWINARIEERDS